MRHFPGGNGTSVSIPRFNVWREQTSVLEASAVYDFAGPGINVTGGDRPEQIKGIRASAGYFAVFGAPVALGRTFTSDEDRPGGPKVAVISNGLWKSRFGGDPGAVGKTILLADEPYTIVGVLGPGFATDPRSDIWLPLQPDPNSQDQANYLVCAARLRPGVTLEKANAALSIAAEEFRRKFPGWMDEHESVAARPLRDAVVHDVRLALLILLGAVACVLLIACANVANLLLARATLAETRDCVARGFGRRATADHFAVADRECTAVARRRRARIGAGLSGSARAAGDQSRRHSPHRRARRGNLARLARPGIYSASVSAHRNSVWLDSRVQRLSLGFGPDAQGKRLANRHRPAPEQSAVNPRGNGNGAGAGAPSRRGAADSHVHGNAHSESGIQPAQRVDDGDVAEWRALRENGRDCCCRARRRAALRRAARSGSRDRQLHAAARGHHRFTVQHCGTHTGGWQIRRRRAVARCFARILRRVPDPAAAREIVHRCRRRCRGACFADQRGDVEKILA